MKRTVTALALLATLTPLAPASAQKYPGDTRITAAQLKDYLTFIASDEMEGRDTPSRGLDTAAKFIATLLSRWGVKPGGDAGTYFQKIALVSRKVLADKTSIAVNGKGFPYGDAYFALPYEGVAEGEAVFVGDGWHLPALNRNPYQGLDIKGKIVVVSMGAQELPQGVTRETLKGADGEAYASPATYARKQGAAGLIYLVPPSRINEWQRLRRFRESHGMRPEAPNTPNPLPTIYAGEALATEIFRGESQPIAAIYGVDGKNATPFALSSAKKIRFETGAQTDRGMTQNVLGIVPGTDPKLKAEYVVVSAHYDHVGVNPRAKGDGIYNGADDDGSGTVAVLAMAEALSHETKRPKRSVLFAWHAGEEKGLWGSQYLTEHPPVPIGQIVTDLNIDMIGRSKAPGDTKPQNRLLSGPNEVYVIGATRMSTELGELCRRVNAGYLKMEYNFRYDDPKDPEQIFFRSDHYNYAVKGIPILFYYNGAHEDYHGVGDQVEKIDFPRMQKITRTVFATMLEVANLPRRPKVDKPLR